MAVRSLTVNVASGNSPFGLNATGDPLDLGQVTVDATSGPINDIDVSMPQGGSISASTVTSNGTGSGQADVMASGAQPVTVSDATISGLNGLTSLGGDTRRPSRANHERGQQWHRVLVASGRRASIDDSLLNVARAASALQGAGNATVLSARHVTIIGDNDPFTTGVAVHGTGGAGTSVTMTDSIMRNLTRSMYTGSMPGTISTDYDDFQGATNASDPHITLAAGTTLTLGSHSIDADPLFVSGADFHLLPTSPGLNADPTAVVSGESSTDLDGTRRCVAGTKRDMGAHQHQPPTASASAAPASGVVGLRSPSPGWPRTPTRATA